jgi:Flp pilus assembly protein TadD
VLYRRALELGPDDPNVLFNLAMVFGRAARTSKRSECSSASRRYARDPDAYAGLGLALASQQKNEEAIAPSAITRAAPEPSRHDGEPGRSAGARAEVGGSAADARRAAELNPDDPDLLYNFGTALSHAGQTEEAIAAYRPRWSWRRAMRPRSTTWAARCSTRVARRRSGASPGGRARARRRRRAHQPRPGAVDEWKE